MTMEARICVDELEVSCLIGCLEAERRTEQTVRIDLWVEVDITKPAQTDALDQTWNYAAIANQIEFILKAGQLSLLESACRVLLRWLLGPPAAGETRPAATAAEVSITKFGVLPGHARPRLRVSGRALDQSYVRETNPWGTVDVIAETDHLGLYRLDIGPGQAIPHHVHRRMRESEMVLTDGLVRWSDGRPPVPLPAGSRRSWDLNLAHGYHNPHEHVASILCLDRPRFDPSDEVEVPGTPPLSPVLS
jgi:dihydroneopterin aldolase